MVGGRERPARRRAAGAPGRAARVACPHRRGRLRGAPARGARPARRSAAAARSRSPSELQVVRSKLADRSRRRGRAARGRRRRAGRRHPGAAGAGAAGSHPPVLADRGLVPALEALAQPRAGAGDGRGRRGASARRRPSRRPPTSSVSEALTNVARARGRRRMRSVRVAAARRSAERGGRGRRRRRRRPGRGLGAAWAGPTASAPWTDRSRWRARGAAGRRCAPACRCCARSGTRRPAPR